LAAAIAHVPSLSLLPVLSAGLLFLPSRSPENGRSTTAWYSLRFIQPVRVWFSRLRLHLSALVDGHPEKNPGNGFGQRPNRR